MQGNGSKASDRPMKSQPKCRRLNAWSYLQSKVQKFSNGSQEKWRISKQNSDSLGFVFAKTKSHLSWSSLACMVTFLLEGEAICDLLWGVLEVVEDLWLGGSLLIHHNHHHHSRRRRFEPQSTEEKRRKEIFGAFSTEAGAKVFVVKQPTKREKKNA